MMYEAKRAFKIFAQSAEAAIKGLCANYESEICATVSRISSGVSARSLD